MVAYFFLGIALLAGVLLILRWFTEADPKALIRVVKWSAVGLAVAAIVFLAATGRLGWVLGFVPFLLPLLFRLRQSRRAAKNYARMAGLDSGGQRSNVETKFLRMWLDHDSNELDGEVLKGSYAGQQLSRMGLAELMALVRTCRADDPASAQVLEAFLDRAHPSWRECEQDPSPAGARDGVAGQSGPMTREEAYEILGLAPGADETEIRAAYHRLISGLHPDRGGSNYLAAQVNQAKQVLLGR